MAQWQALVNMGINFGFHKRWEILIVEGLLASQEGLCFMEIHMI
jgi:hypothetical protein